MPDLFQSIDKNMLKSPVAYCKTHKGYLSTKQMKVHKCLQIGCTDWKGWNIPTGRNANGKRMKQRGKRSNSKLVHVSFDEVERFVPRVPKQICPDEDNTTPRICVAPNILSAIQAMPQGGTVAYNMARIGVPVVIHAYYIESDAILMPEQIADKVPDAVATGEM